MRGKFEKGSERAGRVRLSSDDRASLVGDSLSPKRRGTTLNWWTFGCFGWMGWRMSRRVRRRGAQDSVCARQEMVHQKVDSEKNG